VAVTHWAWSAGAANNRTAKTAETTTDIFGPEILRIAVLVPSSAFTECGNGSLAAFHMAAWITVSVLNLT